MKHIAIVTALPLCRNPRVVKEANALTSAGHLVTVLGPAFSNEHAVEDARIAWVGGWSHRYSVDLRSGQRSGWHLRFWRRLGIEAVRTMEWQTPLALGYGLGRTFRHAQALDADLYICHLESGFWVGQRLAESSHRVGFDFEDWYSEDLLPEARTQRPRHLLRRLEAGALKRGVHVTTTSSALAGALAHEHDAPLPAVVYNAFSWSERQQLDRLRKDRVDLARPSLHWVSQTIGPGRGLETLFEALREVSVPVEVHLRGACSADEEARLWRRFPEAQGHRLYIHALVSTEELLSRIAEHDVGLALEATEPPSRNYTVTNKILHYLLGGLAVVATDTAGQREVAAAAPQAVQLCRAWDSSSLAAAINELLASPEVLARAKQAALNAAQSRFCWEHQVPVLLASIERALEGKVEATCVAS